DQINQGDYTTLAWYAENVSTCTASGAWSGSKATSGTQVLTPTTPGSNIYTLRCTGSGGEVTRSVAVSVIPPPSAVITSFSVDPTTAPLHQPVTLQWATADATACTASSAPEALWSGAVEAGGTLAVTPTTGGEHRFTLSCTGRGGDASASLSVNVTLPATIDAFTGSAASVEPGASATLQWSAHDASACVASGAWSGSKSLSGSEAVTPASGDNYYTLRCYGEGGDQLKTVKISVGAAPEQGPNEGFGGGGALGLWLLPLAGLAALRRRTS
ncbi:MAG: GlyGly-CTERM sorting domain-containing protein, partial [Myxococcota bacterium]